MLKYCFCECARECIRRDKWNKTHDTKNCMMAKITLSDFYQIHIFIPIMSGTDNLNSQYTKTPPHHKAIDEYIEQLCPAK
jgi:hypothetical protein